MIDLDFELLLKPDKIEKKIIINSQDEMVFLAKNIAQHIEKSLIIALYGSLGVGKSFFARNFINYFQERPTQILSPTFNLVYSYQISNQGPNQEFGAEIFHFDLYRIKHIEELENIGFFEAINNSITLIEWPEIAEKYLTKNCLKIFIKNIKNNNPEAREIILKYDQ